MRKIREVLRLKADGFSKRRIATFAGTGQTGLGMSGGMNELP
jgi:hypothetical protein